MIRLFLRIALRLLAWWAERGAVAAERVEANVRGEIGQLHRARAAAVLQNDQLAIDRIDAALADAEKRRDAVVADHVAARKAAQEAREKVDRSLRKDAVASRLDRTGG